VVVSGSTLLEFEENGLRLEQTYRGLGTMAACREQGGNEPFYRRGDDGSQRSWRQRRSLANVVGGAKRQNDFKNVQVQSHNMIIWHNSIATRLVRDLC
jgi:hypothetical protein